MLESFNFLPCTPQNSQLCYLNNNINPNSICLEDCVEDLYVNNPLHSLAANISELWLTVVLGCHKQGNTTPAFMKKRKQG
jgi:hypothetical protein|mmetsp:Transcript_54720/g.91222  ORF Transcript_54720/g.91222 Transcript_54720/m.91222 type:complete len:80 (-) Transcript_54720:364-603(-)